MARPLFEARGASWRRDPKAQKAIFQCVLRQLASGTRLGFRVEFISDPNQNTQQSVD